MNEQSYNILNNFPPEKYNLLVPVQSIQEINPIYKIVVNTVKITPDIVEEKNGQYTNYIDLNKDVYKEKNAQGEACWALTHGALCKLSTAANGQLLNSSRTRSKICEKCIDIVKVTGKAPQCGNCKANANVAWTVIMKFPELSGNWRTIIMTKEIDFTNIQMTDKQMARAREFAGEQAESKAMNRCIRKGLHIKNAYMLEEFKKPFVVVYPVLDAKDADVKRALIAGAIASSNLLYGSGLQQMQLAAAPEKVNEDGEIIEADYETEQPDVGNTEQGKPWDQGEGQKFVCSNPQCNVEIAQNVAEYSAKTFGAAYCIKCQKSAKKVGK